jgi:hypothetical protein
MAILGKAHDRVLDIPDAEIDEPFFHRGDGQRVRD